MISQKRFMDQKFIRKIGHASIIQLADTYTQVNTGQDFVLYNLAFVQGYRTSPRLVKVYVPTGSRVDSRWTR